MSTVNNSGIRSSRSEHPKPTVYGLGNVVLNQRTLWARERAFLGVSCLLFLTSAAATIYWCTHMSGGMPMPGGWIMSMEWMGMPEQGWLGAAAAFMGMWLLMMVAMMLPSLVPMLSSYRYSVREAGEAHLHILTALVGLGYFFVWSVFGAIAYSIGMGLVAAEMRWPLLARSVPVAIGVVILLAGFMQFAPWKSRELARCRKTPPEGSLALDTRSAWNHGLHLGAHCSLCCFGFMLILLAAGATSLGVMALVAAAITVEKFAPRPERAVQVMGVVVIGAGIMVIIRALRIV